jgi:hypothetical protein
MAAEQLGTGGLPEPAPMRRLEWTRGVGETREIEYRGERSAVLAKYEALKNEIGTANLQYINSEGRSRLVARFVRIDLIGGGADGVTIVEELIGQDLVRVITASPYFVALSDNDVAEVLAAVESRAQEGDIDGYAGWAAAKKELRWQMLHGQESYFETVFVLRIRKQGIRSSALRGVFTGINTVVPLPDLSAGMTELVGTLPDGEWLYKPPQVEYVQRGIWSVASEWNWAVKWSIIYGGTLKRPA